MKQFRQWAQVALLGLAVVSRPASGQIVEGDKDISVSGMLQTAVGREKASFAEIEFGYEYFQTRRLAWRIEVGSQRADDGTKSHTETTLGAGAEWNLGEPSSTLVPFMGLEVEHIFDAAGSTNVLSPNIGLRAFVSRNASVDVATYLNVAHDDGKFSAGMQGRFGFSFYFGNDARR